MGGREYSRRHQQYACKAEKYLGDKILKLNTCKKSKHGSQIRKSFPYRQR